MVVICLSDVMDRFHGFLRSVMLNIHPGVYVSADLDAGSRRRIWSILESWWDAEPRGMALMIWRDKSKPMEIDFSVLGAAKRSIIEYDDHYAIER
jgi:CRISPR-associated protein Cas2